MNLNDIKYATASGTSELLPGEIGGASVRAIALAKGDSFTEPQKESATVIIVCSGGVIINSTLCDGRGLFAFAPDTRVEVNALNDSLLLCVNYGSARSDSLPYFIRYNDAIRYKEDCKSEKTVNRMLLPEGLIPNLAIGSVETSGPDAVAAHEHPFCDQLFFSFEENDMEVLIEDLSVSMNGNVLLHIPLGSSHGITVPSGGYAHYLWIDFVVDSRGVEYIKSAHKTI